MPQDDMVTKYIYADDITLTCYGNDLWLVKKHTQKYLQQLEVWIKMWGMEISAKKTFMQYYTR